MNDQGSQVPPTPPLPDEPTGHGTGKPAAQPADGTDAPEAGTTTAARWWQDRKRLAGAAAAVAVVAAVGVGGGYALGHAANGSDVQATGQVGGRFGGQVGGQLGGQPGGPGGEQHVTGTLTAVGASSVTVKTASGSQTYRVTSATQIVQDGAPAVLNQLKTGQSVLVHVFPAGTGDGTAERVLAGSSATDGGFGPPPAAS